jgi:O-Antigen ligase
MDAPDRALGAPGPYGPRRPSGRLLLLYGRLIGILLAGYLMFDKAFAYLHLPGTPLYVGELVIVIGVLGVLSATGYLRLAIRNEPILALLAAFFVWGLIRFLPGYRAYGINAIRDFALCYYSLFAFLVAAALARSPGILERLITQLPRFVPWLLVWLPVGLLVQPLSATHGPNVPFTVYSVWTHEPGNAAFAALISLGSLWLFRGGRSARSRAAWSLMAFLVLALSATQNRGGLIAITAGVMVGLAFLPDRRRLVGRAAAVTVLVLGLAILLPFKFGGVGVQGRAFSASQLLTNVASIGGSEEAGNLGGTVAGRQVLWSLIYHHQTAEGQLLQGAGFGPNLAAEVGIHEGPVSFPLRNPHNSHLDVLARMGLVGFALWIALWLGWYRRLVVGCRRLEQRGMHARRSVAILCLMVATAILASSFFSPQLEGAQVAALLWTAFGIGVAVTSFKGWSGDRDLSLRRSEPPAALTREPVRDGP